jgi:hypothetical protein
MDGVMKSHAKQIASDSIHQLSLDYLIQAQFNSLFNRVWLPREIEHTIVDTIEDVAVQDVISKYIDNIIHQEAPRIADDALQTEKDRQDQEILDHTFSEFLDRCVLESCVLTMAQLYEDEENKIHVKEQQEKALRDHAKNKSNQVKQEYRELNQQYPDVSNQKEPERDAQGFIKTET